MGVLSGLNPAKVFAYFEEICRIPHGSGNEEAISNYLVDFAKAHNLEHYQDEAKNVIMIKEASAGYEDVEPFIIQGHMDMVAVKESDCDIDLAKDPLRLRVDGDVVYAEGTSLGGDDGIAVAYALAILDDDSIAHPRLEVVITTDEEVGMCGATAIDLSMLKGKRLLNIDSEEEGILTVGCAGGLRAHSVLPVDWIGRKGTAYEVRLHGLQGGHSGVEIHKQRGNSNCLMGRLLYGLLDVADYGIVALDGGTKDNAIALETVLKMVIDESDEETVLTYIREFEETLKKELAKRDPDVTITVQKGNADIYKCLDVLSVRKVAYLLSATPDGVQEMSADIPGLVQTSLNLGILRLTEQALELDQSIRSSMASAKQMLKEKVTAVTRLAGGRTEYYSDYPAWEYRPESPLRDRMVAIYERRYGVKPKVEVIHAGLECGLLSAKIPGLDCVSFGPDLTDIHTAHEKMHIASVARTYEYLLEILAEK